MTDTQNGRITLAVLGQKIDTLTKQVDSLSKVLDKVGNNQVAIRGLEENHKNLCHDVEGLEGRINSWSFVNSLGAVAAAIIGIFLGPKQ